MGAAEMVQEDVIVNGEFYYKYDDRLYLNELNIVEISDIKGLQNLTNLKALYLAGNQIEEIKGLDELQNLEVLDLYENNVSNIKGLKNLSKLKSLWFDDDEPYAYCHYYELLECGESKEWVVLGAGTIPLRNIEKWKGHEN